MSRVKSMSSLSTADTVGVMVEAAVINDETMSILLNRGRTILLKYYISAKSQSAVGHVGIADIEAAKRKRARGRRQMPEKKPRHRRGLSNIQSSAIIRRSVCRRAALRKTRANFSDLTTTVMKPLCRRRKVRLLPR